MATPDTYTLTQLAAELAQAEAATRRAAALCPGDLPMNLGLLDRANWLRDQWLITQRRLERCTYRRNEDRSKA